MVDGSDTPGSSPIPRRPRRAWRIGVGVTVLVAGAVGWAAWISQTTPAASFRRGRAALISGDRAIVLRESEALVKVRGHEAEGWLLRGLLLVRQGQLDQAIVYLQRAAEDKSVAVEANTAAAQCFYMSGLYLQAIDASQKALAQDSSCLDARRWLASAYYDLGALTHAVTELELIAAAAPDDARPGRLLGLIAKDGELFSRGVEYYQQSLERDPHQPELQSVLAELAECQIRLNQFDDALATLRDCEPTAAVLTLQADCQSGLGRLDEAHGLLKRALTLDVKYFPARLAQGKLYLDQEKIEESIQALTEAVKLNPHSSQAHFQLSQALRRSGDEARSDDELRQMREIQAMEREFTDLHDTAAANPNDADVRYRTGELARRLGKPQLARIWFRAALAIDPNHVKSRLAIRELES
jgi:tetratricopeptide (TPR) repeat protein